MSETPLPVSRSWGDVFHAALHHDFCPGANQWVYWIKRPEASLALAGVAALAFAVFVQPAALVAFAAILGTLVLGLCWPWLAIHGLRGDLRFVDARTTEGHSVQARLIIRNLWPWPVYGLTLEEGLVPRALGVSGAYGEGPSRTTNPAVALAKVPGWATIEFGWDFRPECRGIYPFETPLLATGFPFGLVRARRSLQSHAELTVWPHPAAVDVLLDSAEHRTSEDLLCQHRTGDCGDMVGTRPFRQGDPLRGVHWAQTARHGQLIVCEREAVVQTVVRIVIDIESDVHYGRGSQCTLEWVIRLAAGVSHIYHQQHAVVECFLGTQEFRITGGDTGWKRFLDELARIPRTGLVTGKPLPTCSHRRHEVLEVIVTTDRRLELQPELQHPCGRQRCVVLRSAVFQHSSNPLGVTLCAAHHWVVIDSVDDIPSQFQRKWRRLCHEH